MQHQCKVIVFSLSLISTRIYMYTCMYTCIYIYMYIYIYIYIHVLSGAGMLYSALSGDTIGSIASVHIYIVMYLLIGQLLYCCN